MLKRLLQLHFTGTHACGCYPLAKHRILGLRRYNIKDANWKDAMELIDKAIQVTSTRQYLAFYQRESIDAPFKLIPLNFSAI